MWRCSLAQRRFQSFCAQQKPHGIYFPLLPRATLPLVCRGSPGRYQGGAEVSILEGLESLHAKGWIVGSRGVKWTGLEPHPSILELPVSWRDSEHSFGTDCLLGLE